MPFTDEEIANLVLSLGSEIRRVRQGRGLSLDDLSELSGVTKSSISRVENNLFAPSTESLLRMHAVLGLDLNGFSAAWMARREEKSSELEGVGEEQRSGPIERLNFLSQPSVEASILRITRSTNVPRRIARESYEEHLICLSGSFVIEYPEGLKHEVVSGQMIGILRQHGTYHLKAVQPAVAINVAVPILADRLRSRRKKNRKAT